MARYTGPMTRKSRRLGVDLVGGDQAFEKRPYPPGQHGRARIKESEYRQQLQDLGESVGQRCLPRRSGADPADGSAAG